MEHRVVGRSGLLVSALGLGGNTFGRSCDALQTAEIVNAALDAGVTLIDTADSYSDGQSEEFIGRALKQRRHEAIVATKTGWPRFENERGRLARSRLIEAVEASLRRLDTDYIDLFYLHHPDPTTPLDETLSTLDGLVRGGKIRYLGCSNYAGWQLAAIGEMSERSKWIPLVASQSEYSAIDRSIEGETMPAAESYGFGLVAYAPLASGFLTGKYRMGEPPPAGTRGADNPMWQKRRLTERNYQILATLSDFATANDRSVADVAIAWVAAQRGVSSVLVGATSVEQLLSNVNAMDFSWAPEEITDLTERLDQSSLC